MKFNKIKKLIVNVDMVVGFVEKGNMADPYIQRCIPFQIKAMEEKDDNTQIVFVTEWHDEDCVEFKYFPPHCIKNTEEAEVFGDLKNYVDPNFVIRKNSTMGMTKEFINMIDKMENLESIRVQGCCTDICVIDFARPVKNYLNEINRDVDIEVYEEEVETYDAPNHNREEYNNLAFRFMEQVGIKVKKIGGRKNEK